MAINKIIFLCLFISVSLLSVSTGVKAQVDTTKKQSVNITSSYQPVLKEPSKINFSGTQLNASTDLPILKYSIPKQNLFYAYQPIPLKPLALQVDTSVNLGDRYLVKAGFGNLKTPFFKAVASFGDGIKHLLNVSGNYIGSQGNELQYQDYNMLGIKAAGSYFLPANELFGSVKFDRNNWYRYGYDQSIYTKNRDSIRQAFQDINFLAGIKNTKTTKTGISYSPTINLGYFTNKNIDKESSILLHIPLKKSFTSNWGASIDFTADLTQQKIITGNVTTQVNNNLIYLTPSLLHQSENVILKAGVTPAWNDGTFELLPNITGEIKLAENIFALQAGWIGKFIKNSYRNLSAVNPWVLPSSTQENTKETEYYGGVKATLSKHLSVNAKAGLVNYRDAVLYINDTLGFGNENNFKVVNESKMRNFRVRGDISYVQEKIFSVNAGLTLNAYNGLQDNARAWNTLPMELRGALRWFPVDKLMVKSDLYLFSGGKYIVKGNGTRSTRGGTDLSGGAEYSINKNFGIWADVNNILNDKYERWSGYQVYGINFMGGLTLRF